MCCTANFVWAPLPGILMGEIAVTICLQIEVQVSCTHPATMRQHVLSEGAPLTALDACLAELTRRR